MHKHRSINSLEGEINNSGKLLRLFLMKMEIILRKKKRE